jgi:recombination associated protein RdgC
MWFKNLQLFALEAAWTLTPGALEAELAKLPLKPCGSQSLQSNGWVSPGDDGALVQSQGRQMLISMGTEQRLLPSSVVNDLAKSKAAEWEKSRGFKPGRKMLRDFKDQAAAELLPRAFISRRSTRAWIDPETRRIIVDASSPARAEAVTTQLRDTLGDLPLALLQPKSAPSATMTAWLIAESAPGRFALGEECELTGAGEAKSVVRYLRHPLLAAQLRRHFDEGFRASKLALVWSGKISLIVTEKLQVKRVKFLDIAEDSQDSPSLSPDQRFDAEFALMTGELSAMIGDLLEAFG